MRRLFGNEGYSLIDMTVGLVLLGIVLLSIYALYRPTFALSRNIGERLAAQQDVRLAIDRVARALHETTMAFGRIRVYSAKAGCTGAYEGCLGFVTARDAECAGSFQLVGGASNWQATIYVWRDTAANELRLHCDPSTTFPVTTWPPPTLAPYTVIGTRVVAASFTLEPLGNPAPTSVAMAVEEQVPGPPRSRLQTTFFNRTVFVPQNR
jgi:type II secretory pathway pseudopilin PulG